VPLVAEPGPLDDGGIHASRNRTAARGRIVVVPIRQATRARDADDNRVQEAAVAGSVDVIISGDADLLSLHEYNGTPILSASDFIARMLQRT
jgi:predicted nucleic acid-binding protein